MALPTHEQIMQSMRGVQNTKVTPLIPTVQPVKKSALQGALEFGKNYLKNFTQNPTGALSKTVAETQTVKNLGMKIPAVKAVKEAVDTKSTAPLKAFGKKALSTFDPEGLVKVGLDGKPKLDMEVVDRISVGAMGAVGEGGNVLKAVSSKLAREADLLAAKALLKKNFRNLADDVIDRIAPGISKSKSALEIEQIITRELRSNIPNNARVIEELKAGGKSSIDGVRPANSAASRAAVDEVAAQESQLVREAAPGTGKVSTPVKAADEAVENLGSRSLSQRTTDIAKKIEAGDKSKAINPDVGGVASKIKEAKTSVLEYLQNADERVRQLVQKPGVVVDDAADPYLKSTLYPGRVGAAMESAKNEVKDILLDMKKTGVTREELSDYLHARHAPERNAALGDGAAGMTTQEAGERLAAANASSKAAQIRTLADKVQEINNRTLEILRKSGVVTEDLYKTLRERYKTHVPLNRLMDDADDFAGALSGKGFDVKSTGIRTAKGSNRKVADILGNVIHNYEQALLRSEKNVVDNATLNFVRKNKDVLGDAFEVVSPKVIGKTFKGEPILEKTNDPRILQMFEDGKRVWVKIKDPKLAIALRGVGRQKIGGILNAVASFTRFYSGLMTRFNPEFAIPNKIRDLQEIAVYLSSQKGVGVKGAAGAITRDPKSMMDVFAALRGKDTPGANLYKEMKEIGGTTGGMGLSTRKQVELNLGKIEKLANSKTKNIGNNLVGYIDNLNTLFEDSTRLSVYKQALSQGLSKERAAFLAKEASINFNRMGTGGPVINALYMFSNASIQGTVKMIRSLKNPKTLGAVSTAVAGSVAAVNEWNDSVDPEWREKVSKWDRLNSLPVMLPNSDGEGASYFTIPVSWGIKPMKVMADYAYDAMSGLEFNARNMMNDLAVAVIQAYNPVGGTDLTSAVTPTILDTPIDIERNVSWTGNKIRPDFDPYAPKDIQYYSSLGDTKTGQAAISVSELLKDKAGIAISPADLKYAYEQYVGGAGRTITKVANTVIGASTGKTPDLDEFPIISRFYRSRTPEEVASNKGSDATTDRVKDILQSQSRDRFKVKNKAEETYESLKAMPPAEANQKFAELKKTDKVLYDKVKETFAEKKLGLSYTERLMKQLGVENGERAKFIYAEVLKLPKDKRNEYFNSLVEKRLVTKAVQKQIKALTESDIIKNK